jgi:release factor glutamine methyltransferase
MRRVIKYIVDRTYRPLLVRYLSGTTTYTHQKITLEIPPEVFHPAFFFSTKLLLKYISSLSLAKKSFLELGAGSGLISMHAARSGSTVTATDINPTAIKALRKNKFRNALHMNVIESDLFDRIPQEQFDIIAINPPYYKKNPASPKDFSWYCGENGEYFQKMFAGLASYIHPTTQVLMILCDGCDIEMIKRIAANNSFRMQCITTHQNFLEKNFIYSISK